MKTKPAIYSFTLLALAMQGEKSFPVQHDTRADRIYTKLPLTAKQKAARAANKRAKLSRKKNR